ncbi:MAG: hypothetical protein V3U98_09095 [Acidobacteriota bacterium]
MRQCKRNGTIPPRHACIPNSGEARGLPAEWLTGYARRVEALTPEQLRGLARPHLRPRDLLLVIAGDEQRIGQAATP